MQNPATDQQNNDKENTNFRKAKQNNSHINLQKREMDQAWLPSLKYQTLKLVCYEVFDEILLCGSFKHGILWLDVSSLWLFCRVFPLRWQEKGHKRGRNNKIASPTKILLFFLMKPLLNFCNSHEEPFCVWFELR